MLLNTPEMEKHLSFCCIAANNATAPGPTPTPKAALYYTSIFHMTTPLFTSSGLSDKVLAAVHVGRRMPASRNTFSKPPNSQTKELCSTLRRRIKGADSTINAIIRQPCYIFPVWLEVIVRWLVPFSLVAYQVS